MSTKRNLIKNKANKVPLSKRLRLRYRLVILNDASFEEMFSLRLTPGNFLILVSAITIVMSFVVISLISFTPLREYIPGYGDLSDKKALLALSLKADSVAQQMEVKNEYIKNLQNVLSGNITADTSKVKSQKSKVKSQNIKH
ncbi:MAG: hypothetical protein ACYDCN_01270 [Bacteroidia bacterium]